MTYPIIVPQDRRSGVYLGGDWPAVAGATDPMDEGRTRIDFCLNADEGLSGSDVQAATFRVGPPSWIAVGTTPDEALAKLRNSL